jgi:hypothetical protein
VQRGDRAVAHLKILDFQHLSFVGADVRRLIFPASIS